MGFQKRLSAPKHYPINRKDNSYVVELKGSRSKDQAIPTALFLRDVLGYADSVSEAKKIVNEGKVQRNGDTVRDVKEGLGVLDVVEVEGLEETYRIVKDSKGLKFISVQDDKVLARVTGKKAVGDEYVYSLHNGENYRTKDEFGVQNSLIFNGGVKEVPLEEGAEVLITGGQHAGETAELVEINRSGLKTSTATVEEDDRQFDTRLENVVAVEDVKVTE